MKKFNLTKRKKIIFLLVLLVVAGAAAFLLTRSKEVVEEITQPNKKYYSQLTGVEVKKDESELPILGVMIENSEEARPQSGLDSAGIVFETVTEAGITRYLLLFQEQKPEVVGPVRSVRPAYVDWAMGFDASIAHVGGSEPALGMLEERNGKTMNEFFNADAYYRNPEREAPHDAYAKTVNLVALQEKSGHKTAKFAEIPRSDEAPSTMPKPVNINIRFSYALFDALFTYDATTNSYVRSLAGAPHIDANTNKQISVKNLITIKKDIQGGSLGSGVATLYKDGIATEIKWEQKDYRSRIRFTNSDNTETALNRGDTWISVLPPDGTVTIQ